MIVQAIQPHRALGEPRRIGDVFHINADQGQHLKRAGLVREVVDTEEWFNPLGRELRTEPLTDKPWPTVVACLNIWNDRPALEQTLPSWAPMVDALVVADGAYGGGLSTDGVFEWMGQAPELLPEVWSVPHETNLPEQDCLPWPDQNSKRTALLREAAKLYPDALLLIIDADEYLATGLDLHRIGEGDVGWVTLTSPIYKRPYGQPRLIRARPDLAYRGRHHWLYAGDRLLATHQYGAPGWEHRLAPVFLRNQRGLGHSSARQQIKQAHLAQQQALEAPALTGLSARSDATGAARESLQIAQTTTYDPGMVAFRLHTAINTTTPHASVFLRRGRDNPFSAPRQYDVDQDVAHSKQLLGQADVVHCHLDYTVPDSLQVRPRKLVIHHHGTHLRNHAVPFSDLDKRAQLRLVSNLELLSYGTDLRWLPNPVSVARLKRLRASVLAVSTPSIFRVAHSPSKRHLKGTDEFLAACTRLNDRGVFVEPVLIEGKSHTVSLQMKAGCHACFDSFWLGIQCSGIEAAGMGLPVLAGDPVVRDRYLERFGAVPYTFVADGEQLESALERLVMDQPFRIAEAARVYKYVEAWHDDASVALQYLDLLDEAIGWRQAKAVKSAPQVQPLPQGEATP